MQFHKGIDGNVLVATVATGNTYSFMLRRIADEVPGGDPRFTESEEIRKGEWTIKEYRTVVLTGSTFVHLEMRNAEAIAWLMAEFASGVTEDQIDAEMNAIINAIKE